MMLWVLIYDFRSAWSHHSVVWMEGRKDGRLDENMTILYHDL